MHSMTILADPKKRLILLASIAGAVLLLLIYTLAAGDEAPEPVSVATAPPSAPAPASGSQPVSMLMPGAAPPPPASVATTAPPPAASPVPTGGVQGLRLHGITSGGAIIGLPSGRQRLVRIGQQVLPGVVLQGIAQQHAMLGVGAGTVRLTFQGPEAVAAPGAPSASLPSPAERQMRANRTEERRYLLGMQPRTAPGGAVTGYIIRRGADLPLLRQAGLREGDVLISVNGQNIDGQERLTQITSELAGARSALIEYERGGGRTTVSVPLNTR
jgi:general secretion pathway protein C